MPRTSSRLAALASKPMDDPGGGATANENQELNPGGDSGEDDETSLQPVAKRSLVLKATNVSRRVSTRETTKATQSVKGGGEHKLERLKDMPLDILREICSHLDSLNLLYMARVSKSKRNLLMSRSSAWIWNSARRAVDLPDLEATDFSEPAYASLVFEEDCQICHSVTSNKGVVDYYVRLRACKSCREVVFRMVKK